MLLFRQMIFSGVVIKHTRNGTKFGFPTANVNIDDKSLNGLFIGYTSLLKSDDQNVLNAFKRKELPSVIFVGAPETLNETNHRLESYILDFPLIDLYDSEIKVEIVEKLRDNKKFDSVEDLIKQMKKDEAKARIYFSGKKS
jgi:riboflavin kinase / FMN adenylyltransferase